MVWLHIVFLFSSRLVVDREASLAISDKIHTIANFESKLFANFSGKRDASVESNHCGGHLEPLQLL